jgi:hypothetical protein
LVISWSRSSSVWYPGKKLVSKQSIASNVI